MTPEEMRVAVAKDVILQIKAKKYHAEAGTYCEFDLSRPIPEGYTDMREVVNLPMDHCEVCAVGSLFLSKARLFNNVPLAEVELDPGDDYGIIGGSVCRAYLKDIFDREQLSLIECAFERSFVHALSEDDAEKVRLAVLFGERYEDDSDRMVAIMDNIVKNNGTFKP